MKKLLISVIIFIMTLSLFSCEKSCIDNDGDGKCDDCGALLDTNKTEDPKEDDEEHEDSEKSDAITLIDNGKANFTFVIQKGSSSSLNKRVDNLIKTLKNLDVKVDKVYDEKDNAVDCEVIIGVPENRGEKYEYDIHSLGKKGYAIKLIDGKILIVGGSENSLIEAIDFFESDFLGITKKAKELTTVKVTKEQDVQNIQDDYRITALKLNDNDMRGYTIAANVENKYAEEVALYLQDTIYDKSGYWFDIVALEDADKSIVIDIKENSYEDNNGYSMTVNESSIVFETEFPDIIMEKVSSFLAKTIIVGKGEINFTRKDSHTENVRVIYYETFGKATGDGITDDFEALKKTHEYANEWGHTVKAKTSSVFYIGGHTSSIIVQTDTDWQGCKFIFDDSGIDPYDKTTGERSKESSTPIFLFKSSTASKSITNKFSHVTPENPLVDEGVTTNIGFAPGVECMIILYNYNVKHFIRFGPNQDNGAAQQELIIVDAEGNIDPSTPLQWTYDTITSATMYSITDRPIKAGNAVVQTISNQAPSAYTYYSRNFEITRSNVTLYGLDHTITNEGDTGAPYNGFTAVSKCANVTISDCKFFPSKDFSTIGSAGVLVGMGSYEIHANSSNNVMWKNCTQYKFFDELGYAIGQGTMGTNYCKNLFMDNCFTCSFDAHKGTYNATLTNSTFEHINFIGEGKIYLENVTIHVDPKKYMINLRDDYGATWEGDLEIVNCNLYTVKSGTNYISLINTGTHHDHYFGYTCYLPENIKIDGLKITGSNQNVPVHLYYRLDRYFEANLALPGAQGVNGGLNPYVPTKSLDIKNCDGINWVLPATPQFQDMIVYINGKEITNWKEKYGTKLSN